MVNELQSLAQQIIKKAMNEMAGTHFSASRIVILEGMKRELELVDSTAKSLGIQLHIPDYTSTDTLLNNKN